MNPLGKSGFFICVISLFLVLYRVKKVVNKRILCLDSYRSRWSGMAFHSLLQRRFAPRKMVHLPSFRSRMTGRYLLLLCKKRFFVYSLSCPFRRLTPPPLSQGKASHTLLQRRSAPRKVVRLLPVSGDGFHFVFFSSYKKIIYSHTVTQFTSAVILERWTESECRWKKKISYDS